MSKFDLKDVAILGYLTDAEEKIKTAKAMIVKCPRCETLENRINDLAKKYQNSEVLNGKSFAKKVKELLNE